MADRLGGLDDDDESIDVERTRSVVVVVEGVG